MVFWSIVLQTWFRGYDASAHGLPQWLLGLCGEHYTKRYMWVVCTCMYARRE